VDRARSRRAAGPPSSTATGARITANSYHPGVATNEPAPPPPGGAVELLRRHGGAVDAYLVSLRGRFPTAPPRLLDAVDYSLTAGGKRLRPALVLETAHACGGEPGDPSALAAAGAIELIHTFSLVHDDLPAMDDDDLRRGRPTNHKVFGEAMAILAGDAMVALAFELLATDAAPAAVPALVRELAAATGPAGMIGGQVLDMAGENVTLSLEELRHLHAMKTGALLTCACRMGAIAARADARVLEAVTAYGRHLGLAFQIVDDLLDVTATPEQMGKATGKDAGRGKNTYPSLIGVEESRREAGEQLAAAVRAVERLGRQSEGLQVLSRFVVERRS
jgi:geranylgeranyl pyrophosphate synthase